MKLNGAQIIVKLLQLEGIKTVSGIPGGSILPLYDELVKSGIKHILVRHEQAAGFIAQGMARSTGKPAVCMATSGPGAMNLLTAIADARSDSIPIIAITGQVNSSLIGTDAFQEADTFGLSFPITKHSIAVKSPEELFSAIPDAFKIAVSGRPGPVLVDVPRDVQLAEIETDFFENKTLPEKNECKIRFETTEKEIKERIEDAVSMLSEAVRPVLYIGGGCNSPEASEAIRNFKEIYRMPVVSSLMGLGAISSEDADFAGMVGMHGSYAANYAMYKSTLVFAAGVRFDDRATGIIEEFCPEAQIIHIDIDAAEINKILDAGISFVSKIEKILPRITEKVSQNTQQFKMYESERSSWAEEVISVSKENFSLETGSPGKENRSFYNGEFINPREFIKNIPSLAEKCGTKEKDILVTTDVGQHQMFAAQYYPIKEVRSFFTSGSLGTMGFGLPAAIGAALSNPEKRVICFSGDGSILMNIQEFATLSENNLPVTVIIFQNGTLGMVYQQQKYLFKKNYSASEFISNPDFLQIARGFGIEGTCANTDSEWYKKAFDSERKNKPFVVTVNISPEEDVLPYVPGGKRNIDAIK